MDGRYDRFHVIWVHQTLIQELVHEDQHILV